MSRLYADLTLEQKERRRESQRAYRRRHPEKAKASKAAWEAANPKYHREWNRRHAIANPLYKALKDARLRAKKEGVLFDLSYKDILIPTYCPVLGIKIATYNGKNARHNSTPSLDRLVPSKGYTKENVRVISFRANRLKNNATIIELRRILAYMEAG